MKGNFMKINVKFSIFWILGIMVAVAVGMFAPVPIDLFGAVIISTIVTLAPSFIKFKQ